MHGAYTQFQYAQVESTQNVLKPGTFLGICAAVHGGAEL